MTSLDDAHRLRALVHIYTATHQPPKERTRTMKTGKTLVELAQELDRQAKTRQDFVAPTDKLVAYVGPNTGTTMIAGLPDSGAGMTLTDLAHGQVAEELKIPKAYYDRMVAEAPGLWAENVNHWFKAGPKRRLVRVLDGKVRAFLSDSYRPLDCLELVAAIVPAFRGLGDVEVVSSEITEKKLYIKAVRPSVQWDLAMLKAEAMRKAGDTHSERPKPDVIRAAITISNSEVGCGSLAIDSGIEQLSCYNLATMMRESRKFHVGRKHTNGNGNGADGDDVYRLLSTEAREADDKAFWLRVRDVAAAAFSAEKFQANAERFAGACLDRIEGKVEKVVETTAVVFGLSESAREGVLRHLIEGGDLSRLGLVNAVTRQSQDEKDYDVATDMERLGGKILALPKAEWRGLASQN